MGEQKACARAAKERVLILDVDERILIILERVLEEAGFDTTTTWSSADALLLLKTARFDLIVVGDHPPEIDAHAVLRWRDTIDPRVPCIVMRAARKFGNRPDRRGLVTCIPGCTGTEILEQVRQHLSPSVPRPAPPSTLCANPLHE